MTDEIEEKFKGVSNKNILMRVWVSTAFAKPIVFKASKFMQNSFKKFELILDDLSRKWMIRTKLYFLSQLSEKMPFKALASCSSASKFFCTKTISEKGYTVFLFLIVLIGRCQIKSGPSNQRRGLLTCSLSDHKGIEGNCKAGVYDREDTTK